MEFSKHNWATIRQVGLLDIFLSEYPDKSHNFRNFIFMTSHFSTLLHIILCVLPSLLKSKFQKDY